MFLSITLDRIYDKRSNWKKQKVKMTHDWVTKAMAERMKTMAKGG
jgi:uncharacterized protein